MSKMIYVNLPVRDLAASTRFYIAIGGTLNPQFSNDQASSIMFSDAIGVMLLTHEHYSSVHPAADRRSAARKPTMIVLTVESRDAVDTTLARAVAAGGRADPNPPHYLT